MTGAQTQFCERQDEQVTKRGILSAVRASARQHRAHLSLCLAVTEGLITGPAGDSCPILQPKGGARRWIKQVGHPKGRERDLHTWEKPADAGKALLG